MKVYKMTAHEALAFAEYVQRNFEIFMNRYEYIGEPEKGNWSEDEIYSKWLNDDSND